MRQVVLDTETTGLEVEQDHRVIEIGCVELFNRRLTGRSFHRYLNPERDIDEGALEVHGLSREQLAKEARFADIHAEFLDFVRDAELIIHNAAFDVAFLDAELARLGDAAPSLGSICRILDSLSLARQLHPGQRNSLDALCRRYSVDNSHRDYHGALLDARLLAEVYLAMTGGQATFVLGGADADPVRIKARTDAGRSLDSLTIVVVRASEEEMGAHEHVLALLDKASAGKTVWRAIN
jgi:DNA polymerase-3 subunit epsilon